MPDSARNMNVCFLLGSGASVPANYPTVTEITEHVRSGSQEKSLVGNHSSALSEGGRRLLRWLEIQIKRRYESEGDRAVTYENLYFLANQLREDMLGEYDNPALRSFVEAAIEQVLPQTQTHPGNAHEELQRLTEDVTTHIRRIVASLISRAPMRLDHLDFIIEAIHQGPGSLPEILTLNHDTLLETGLTGRKIEFTDGFAKAPNSIGVREWRPGESARNAKVLRVLKLHGGIDWFRFRPQGAQPWLEDYVGILTSAYSLGANDSSGRRHEVLDPLPIFMVGAWDKLARYTDAVYLELYHAAFQALGMSDVLIVVGYGFGDKGINKLVTDWMCRSLDHRLVVVDRSALSLWQRARGAIAFKWQDWLAGTRLVPLEFDLSNTTSKLSWLQIKLAIS